MLADHDSPIESLDMLVEINRSALTESTDPNFEFKYIDLSSVKQGSISETLPVFTFDESPVRARRLMSKGDILMSTVRPNLQGFARITFEPSSYVCSTGFSVLSPRDPDDSEFLFQSLFCPRFSAQISKLLVGSSYPAINSSEIKALTVYYPRDKNSRIRIAAILATWDRAIEQVTKLIEAKTRLKKGLMQQLLTGKKRLPGYREKWKAVRVGDIAEIGRGRVISHIDIRAAESLYPVYSSQSQNDGVMGYIDTFDFDGEYITWTTDGVYAGSVFYRTGKFNCTNVCGTIKIAQYDAYLVSLVLKGIAPKFVSKNLANPKLMNGVMKQIPLVIPSDVSEQKALSSIFRSCERELIPLKRILELLTAQKQALMQVLLTGKVRVKTDDKTKSKGGKR